MRSILNKNRFGILALIAGLSSTAFADFGDDKARLYCQVTCKGMQRSFGSFPLEKGLEYGQILGLWTDSGFVTNQAQYDEVAKACYAARYDIVHQDPLRKKIYLQFLRDEDCILKPLAYAWYNPLTAYEISVMKSKE